MDASTSQAVKAPTVKLLIGGQFVESKTTQWRDVVNPATQQVLARVPFATPDEINAAVASAKDAFKTWKKTPIGTRARIFLKLQQLIRENMKELAALLTAEQGKTLPDAEGDVFRGLEVVEHAANIGTLQLGELANNVANGVDTYSIMQPLGVCAGITPFNFPAMIPLWMFPMAIATGNTFVLKPSEQDPMVTMELVKLAIEAGIPKGVLNVVHGAAEVVDAICDHPDIKAISFVGSTKVGTHVYNRASLAGKRVQCMMGA
ncbi:MAG: aldehyde dehydrogenase family protein, partial [Diaphorobacter sp.]|nr:aldehyde dehydrogenase family protein [Diaphorobacter sp.]